MLSTDEIPVSLQKPLPTLDYSGLLLPDPHKPVATKWQPLSLLDRVDLHVRQAPQGWLSAVRARYRKEAARRVDSFTGQEDGQLVGWCC